MNRGVMDSGNPDSYYCMGLGGSQQHCLTPLGSQSAAFSTESNSNTLYGALTKHLTETASSGDWTKEGREAQQNKEYNRRTDKGLWQHRKEVRPSAGFTGELTLVSVAS